jgi:hypothetical protein
MSMTTTDLDRARPGDPIYHHDILSDWCLDEHDSFRCTRPEGHAGQHVACGHDHVVSVWPQTSVVAVRLDEARQTTADELLRAVTADPRLWDRLPRRVVAALAAQAEATERVAS